VLVIGTILAGFAVRGAAPAGDEPMQPTPSKQTLL